MQRFLKRQENIRSTSSFLLMFECVSFCFLRVSFIMAIPRDWFVFTEEQYFEYTRLWHGRRDVKLAPPTLLYVSLLANAASGTD